MLTNKSPLRLDGWTTPDELCCAKINIAERQVPPESSEQPPPPPQPHHTENGRRTESSLLERLFGGLNNNGELLNVIMGFLGKNFKLDASTLLNLFNKDDGMSGLLGSLGSLFKKQPQADADHVNLNSYKRID